MNPLLPRRLRESGWRTSCTVGAPTPGARLPPRLAWILLGSGGCRPGREHEPCSSEIQDATLDAVHPDRGDDDRLRRISREEAAESNAHTVRWLVPFLAPMHAIVIGVLLSSHETNALRVAWLSWLVSINAIVLGCGLVASFVAWRRRSSAIYAVLGDIGGVVYLLGAAAMTANAQRAYPNLNIFLVTALFTAIRLRMRPAVYVVSLLAGVALVLLAMTRFRAAGVLRTADDLTLLSISAISAVTFFLTRGMWFREIRARCQNRAPQRPAQREDRRSARGS